MGVFGSQGATAAPLCDSAVSEAGGSLRQRSPEDDDHDHVAPDSSRCHGDMHHKYDRRADLDRMTSRRTFSMVPPDNAQQGGDKYGQQVRRRFSRGGHRPGARSGGNPSMDPANEVDGMATEKVCFRSNAFPVCAVMLKCHLLSQLEFGDERPRK